MANTGINYYFDLIGVTPSRFKVYYDFNQSGEAIASVPLASGQYSGVPSSVGGFWSSPGSGHFTGQNVQISNASELTINNGWTMMIVCERQQTGSMVLFSNFKTGIVEDSFAYLGFSIGLNAANRLYFEAYDDEGPYCRTFEKNLATKNCLFVSATPNNQLIFGYYNPLTRKLETQIETIKTNFLFDSDSWYLGGSPESPDFAISGAFNGYLDEFLFFDASLDTSILNELFKGFYSNSSTETLSFIQSCGMDEVVLLKDVRIGDICTWYSNTGQISDEFNYLSIYNKATRTFKTHTPLDSLALYVNGAFQTLGTYLITGDIYHRGISLSGDYFLRGDSIESNMLYNVNDETVYDFGTNTGIYTSLVSGRFIIASGDRFLQDTSTLYINGLRQLVGRDFLEVSSFNPIKGSGIFDKQGFLVYNNNGLFWK